MLLSRRSAVRMKRARAIARTLFNFAVGTTRRRRLAWFLVSPPPSPKVRLPAAPDDQQTEQQTNAPFRRWPPSPAPPSYARASPLERTTQRILTPASRLAGHRWKGTPSRSSCFDHREADPHRPEDRRRPLRARQRQRILLPRQGEAASRARDGLGWGLDGSSEGDARWGAKSARRGGTAWSLGGRKSRRAEGEPLPVQAGRGGADGRRTSWGGQNADGVGFSRPQLRYHEFLNKRHLVNPKKSGPFHHRAPSRILYRTIRGMVPHKVRRASSSRCANVS